MLIIFDLDDTLIDTSGSITPVRLEAALRRMSEAGLVLENFEEALKILKQLNATAQSARQALKEFLEIHEAEARFFSLGIEEIYENISLNAPVEPLEGALELLVELKEAHELALVTVGSAPFQLEKMKKAGVDSTIFSRIAVSEEGNKKTYYQEIVTDLGYPPSEVLVCGDRISADLSPAKELGFRTVHLLWGRGLNSFHPESGKVDATILKLADIKKLLI